MGKAGSFAVDTASEYLVETKIDKGSSRSSVVACLGDSFDVANRLARGDDGYGMVKFPEATHI